MNSMTQRLRILRHVWILLSVLAMHSHADYTAEERREVVSRYQSVFGAGSECYDREHEMSDIRVGQWITRIGRGLSSTPDMGLPAGLILQILGGFAVAHPENHRCLCERVRVSEVFGLNGDDKFIIVVERLACVISYPVRCWNLYEKCCYKPSKEVGVWIEITPAGRTPDCE